MGNKRKALYELFKNDFPEFRHIAEELLFDKILFEMLSEYNRCKIVSNKFIEADKRRIEYNIIKDELHNEIRDRIMCIFYSQC